jgi:Raf kinase inhibitor-like YbhB/YbcL family protein
LLVAACGSDSSTAPDAAVEGPADAAIDAPQPFTMSSPELMQQAFVAANTCDGANTSPQLAWSGYVANPQSFAVVFTDMSNDLVHWVIYDIPADATGLPANVMKAYAPTNVPGAHQTASYQAATRGYLGPCPPPADQAHTYEFAVYALDVATLPGAMMNTTRAQAVPLIIEHQIAKATLTGTYDR